MNPAPLPTLIPHFGDLEAWVGGTFYAIGQRVTNVSKIYQCTTQGTSDLYGSGPTGTGGAIADGTVVWAYQAEVSTAWTGGVSYTAGDVVTNDGGKLYEAQSTGTSDLYGSGPTGTGGAIADGGVIWSYVSSVAALQTQPTSRVKDLGQVVGASYSAPYFNWRWSVLLSWLYYLRDLAADAWTWTAAHVFTKGITVTQSDTDLPAITATGNGVAEGVLAMGGSDGGTGVQGTGGASGGIGIKGTGDTTGPGGYFTPGATGPAAQFNAISTSDRATVEPRNEDGHIREVVDHRGFVMGRVNRFDFRWDKEDVAIPTAITDDVIAASVSAYSADTSARVGGMPDRYAQWNVITTTPAGGHKAELWAFDNETLINCQTGGVKCLGHAINDDAWLATAPLVPNDTDIEFVAEWECAFDDNTHDIDYAWGLCDTRNGAISGTRWALIRYRKTNNSAHWVCSVKDGSGTSANNTSLAVAPDTYYAMRLEMYGSGKCRFFINGNLFEVNRYPASILRFCFGGAKLDATADTAFKVKVGQVRMRWNRVTAPSLIG